MPGELDGSQSLKRHAALVALSRDHHFVLMQALALRRVAEAPRSAGHSAVATAEAFLGYYEEEMLGHMSDEEEALLPLAAPIGPEGAQRVVAEHEDIRDQAAVLRQALADGTDPRPMMQALGDLLHDHVRFEERVFFEAIQAGLPPSQMEAIGRSIEAHREARGHGAGCSLPRPGILPAREVEP
jgi:iron-sulfur cluster repair protein YtfE (RIC family)